MDSKISNNIVPVRRFNRRIPCPCIVCGDAALYSYFGAVVCPSCKMFFKRNANNLQRNLNCKYNCSCEINIDTRQRCSYCRLAKCFTVGMQIYMIRTSRIIENKNQQTSDSMYDLTRNIKTPEAEQLPTLNLVRRDLSKFSRDEWNLLSNVLHCFDQYIGYAFTEDFIKHQNTLPPKLRYKCAPLKQFLASSMNYIQDVVEKNRDFLSLSSDDRVTLLRTTAEYTITMGGIFLVRHYQLYDDPYYYKSVQILFRPDAVALTKYIIDQLDPDDTFIQLIFSLLSFSTINYKDYTRSDMNTLNDIRTIITIQDMYTTLVWKYMLYRYGQDAAVKRFSKLNQCLLHVIDFIRRSHESDQFNEMIHVVVEQTKQHFIYKTELFFVVIICT